MPKKLDLTDNLEKYIINHSEDLNNVQKKIIEYNNSLGEQKKLQISVSQGQLLQSISFVTGISHAKVFPKVKAIMHHGGVGTVHAALRAGTVSIIVPFIVDQPWWADRLNRLNLGPKALPLRKFTKDNVMKRIIETTKYQDNVKNIANLMKQDNGVNMTLDLITKYLTK